MNDNNELISIISPCFNSAEYVQRMLDSVRSQTYKNIEMICVDDGSEDSTVEIIKSNIQSFKNEGMKLTCIQKEHEGQAAAVNTALKIIEGDYFALIDSDDFLLPTSIERRANILREKPEYGIVVSDYYIVNEDAIDKAIGRGNEKLGYLPYQENQFELLIMGLSIVADTGYMIRTKYFRAINPSMEINKCIEGQNYQILLPMYFYYQRYYIDEPLAVYVIRELSHDHKKRTNEDCINRGKNLLVMLEEVLMSIGISKRNLQKYLNLSSFNKLLEY